MNVPNETTVFKLIIAENNPQQRVIWEKVFAGEHDVQVINENFPNLGKMEEVDAVFMMQHHAHERFGGKAFGGNAPVDKSLIYENWQTQSLTSKKVVTSIIKVGKQFAQDKTPQDSDYLTFADENFAKIFTAISQFNLENPSNSIRVFGIHPLLSATVAENLELLEKYVTVVKNNFHSCKPALDRSLAG